MKIAILGGDGFCGWPAALHLSERGHDVITVDNMSRRRIDDELGAQSLTPIRPLVERLRAWTEVSGKVIEHRHLDVAEDYEGLLQLISEDQPDAVVHFADLVRLAGVIQDPLGRRGLARVDVGHDAEVAVVFDFMRAGHRSVPWGLRTPKAPIGMSDKTARAI